MSDKQPDKVKLEDLLQQAEAIGAEARGESPEKAAGTGPAKQVIVEKVSKADMASTQDVREASGFWPTVIKIGVIIFLAFFLFAVLRTIVTLAILGVAAYLIFDVIRRSLRK